MPLRGPNAAVLLEITGRPSTMRAFLNRPLHWAPHPEPY